MESKIAGIAKFVGTGKTKYASKGYVEYNVFYRNGRRIATYFEDNLPKTCADFIATAEHWTENDETYTITRYYQVAK